MRTSSWLLALVLALVVARPAQASSSCAVARTQHAAFGLYRTDPVVTGEVALTFDDGPLATATPRVLDMLAEHHMKAAFFVVGRNISRSTYAVVQRMVAEGHTVGSHCYTHDVKMTRVARPEETVRTIVSQHEVTAVLVDLALLARSGDDFDALYRRVMGSEPGAWIGNARLRDESPAILARHGALLAERGFAAGQRPYHVVYARPPGGGPYQESGNAAGVALYDQALRQLGMVGVLWHGGAGETDPRLGHDVAFLTGNISVHSKRGGILLVHDEIVPAALAEGLRRIAANPGLRVRTLDEVLSAKFGCDATAAASAG